MQPIEQDNSAVIGEDFSSVSTFFKDTQKKLMINLDPSCENNDAYNACIFWKNPVAQMNRTMALELNASSDLRGEQIHGVVIDGFDQSGFLKNSTFSVKAANAKKNIVGLSTKNNNFKFNYGNDPDHRFSQVMAFYWLNTQKEWMEQWSGHFYVSGKGVDVISYVPGIENAYWNYETESILLGETKTGAEFALNAEVYAHEMGHANASYATNFKIFETVGSANSVSCEKTVCCKDASGCSWAIDEGLADYHFAILFPDHTAMLETLVNDTKGVSECGVTREVDKNASLTSEGAYSACQSPYKGEVHLMGRVYASAWWEIRKAAEAENPGEGARHIDMLFTNHLPTLTGQDNFSSAFQKILATEKVLLKGQYAAIIKNEFSQRGIF